MGRRKIEIKAIKDDRNRSVTFLKRKGGLFKKAHELSVLCSVDVAVIIFGHNKKLYEYSSGDISDTLSRYQYYGQPHEHKGPADFSGKRGEADDDDDDDISPPPDEIVPQPHAMVPPHMQNQSGFQHINHAPSASPPMHGLPNGGIQYHRHSTPQPSQGASRPSSRNNPRRSSSTIVPQQNPQAHAHATPPPQQNGYTYMQNHTMYNGQPNSNMTQHPAPAPAPAPAQYAQYGPPPQHPLPQQQSQQQPLPQAAPQHHHQPSQPPHTSHQQVSHVQQQAYLQQDQQRQSVPPALAQHERAIPPPEPSPPQQQHQFQQPPAKQEDRQSPPQPKPLPVKSRSIFTPIDDRGSVLAQHFGFGPPTSDASRSNPSYNERAPSKDDTNGHVTSKPPPPPAPVRSLTHPQRAQSTSSVPDIPPPSRTNSAQMTAKRPRGPRLTVQIPSENSDGGSATADSSPRDSAANKATTPAKGSSNSGPPVVLPPPSPSASALMSAGAQGPPNPFARPPPPVTGPQSSAPYNANNNIETPVSALPSRFMADGLLPSPSSFYPEWGFGRSGPDSNLLPSPLTFPTPTMQTGPGFSKEGDDSEKKRKSPEAGSTVENVGPGKRLKT